jgi:hypothetical protein
MGWSEVAARSHARRLENERWLARYPMTRGEGSLFVATRTGVPVLGRPLRPASPPGPTWWAHHCGCAWTAAWLRVRDRRFMGDRELLDDPRWSGQTTWSDFRGYHHGRHRPDIVGLYPNGDGVPIEVELQQKSLPRLRGILSMYLDWRFDRHIGGLIYVCGNQDGADRNQANRQPDRTGRPPAHPAPGNHHSADDRSLRTDARGPQVAKRGRAAADGRANRLTSCSLCPTIRA